MIIVVMGVSGSGKTTIGRLLAEDLGWPYHEGDDYHPPANVEKMSRGIPLTDDDRRPWLDSIRQLIQDTSSRGQNSIIACSALKQAYRDHLKAADDGVVFVYLKGDYEAIRPRLGQRPGHFMKAGMLESQFQTLEEPQDALTLDSSQEPGAVVEAIKATLRL